MLKLLEGGTFLHTFHHVVLTAVSYTHLDVYKRQTPGGAEPMCKSGIFEQYRIRRIFGFHVWPMLDKGVIATRKNEFMARSSEVNIDITGKSAHAAKYKEGIDAMEIAARYLLDLYKMEKEELSPETYRLLRFGLLKSGTVRNVVANHARLEGTLRAFQDETYQYMKQHMFELAKTYEEQGAGLDRKSTRLNSSHRL